MTTPRTSLAVTGGVATLTLTRSGSSNAVDLAMCHALRDDARRIAADGTIRVVHLRAEGRHFCVGGDLGAFADAPDDAARGALVGEMATTIHEAVLALATQRAPVVVEAQGASAGAGLSLVAGTDLAIVGEGASFATAYTALGLSADAGATWYLPRLIGLRRAQQMLLTSRRLSAREALDWGLVSEVVPDADLAARASAVVAQLASAPTEALGAVKRLLLATDAASLADHLTHEAHHITRLAATRDFAEGVAAVRARRPARFDGSRS